MKFTAAAVLAAAVTGVSAWGNVTYETEVVTAYTTYCPEPTTLTYSDKTYTITEATTLTITDCPCTISKPVMTTSSVYCYDCPATTNSTMPTYATSTMAPPTVPTAGAAKAVAVSGAGLAGLLGLAALL